jgi:hypothetical protein
LQAASVIGGASMLNGWRLRRITRAISRRDSQECGGSTFEAVSREAITAASSIDDASLRNSALSIVGWAEFHRGRM